MTHPNNMTAWPEIHCQHGHDKHPTKHVLVDLSKRHGYADHPQIPRHLACRFPMFIWDYGHEMLEGDGYCPAVDAVSETIDTLGTVGATGDDPDVVDPVARRPGFAARRLRRSDRLVPAARLSGPPRRRRVRGRPGLHGGDPREHEAERLGRSRLVPVDENQPIHDDDAADPTSHHACQDRHRRRRGARRRIPVAQHRSRWCRPSAD